MHVWMQTGPDLVDPTGAKEERLYMCRSARTHWHCGTALVRGPTSVPSDCEFHSQLKPNDSAQRSSAPPRAPALRMLMFNEIGVSLLV